MTLRHKAAPDGKGLLLLLGWAAAAILAVLLFAAGAPVLMHDVQASCSGPDCPWFQLSASMVESLRRLGLSVHGFALVVLVIDAIPMVVCLALSTLLVWRHRHDWMGWPPHSCS